jgi:predicted metal-binding membrane protein
MQIGDRSGLAFVGMCLILMAIFVVLGIFVIPKL